MTRVVGLDLSLTSTGIAVRSQTSRFTPKIRADATLDDKLARIDAISAEVSLRVQDAFGADLVIVEGPSYGSKGGSDHERGGLWWEIVGHVRRDLDIPLLVAAPTMLKKYATGKGNAQKDEVLMATARRFEWFAGNNDEADALWACAMGHEWLGDPIVSVPKAHLEALKTWPDKPRIAA